MNWARNIFVKNAKLYELVLEGMWDWGEEDALAISGLLQENGMEGCRVLDVPCGIGRVGIPLARLGFEVTGLDYSPHLVNVAKELAKHHNVGQGASFVSGDMLDLASRFEAGSFDCAINVFTSIGYGSEADDSRFFTALRKVVRRGGLFLISGLRNRDYIERNPSQNVYEENSRLVILDRYEYDPSKSRERGLWRFYLKVGRVLRPVGEFPTDIRLYSPHELSGLLEESGWRVDSTYESLKTKAPFTTDTPAYSLVAEAI